MKVTGAELEQEVYRFIDELKDMLSPRIWENLLLDCTKNELLILWLLYRQESVNMTGVADYIHVPLNTATGIIARMEKRQLVVRERSIEDKRIVTIKLGEKGREQIQAIFKEFMFYAGRILETCSEEEIGLFFHMMQKIMGIMKEERRKEKVTKVRKIVIE